MNAGVLAFDDAEVVRGAFRFRSGAVRPRAGRVTVLLGPTGGGKTTALRVAAGLLVPVRGCVLLDGSPVHAVPATRRAARLAYVPQRPEVGLPFRVDEVVALGLHARRADDASVGAALEQVGLQGLAHRAFHTLSAGQQQRAAVARALAQHGPGGVLLLDEAFSAIDPPECASLVRVLRGLASAGATILAATHDLAVAAALADDAWLIRDGATCNFGPAADLLAPGPLGRFLGVSIASAVAAGGRTIAVADLAPGGS